MKTSSDGSTRPAISRRTALLWVARASSALMLTHGRGFAQQNPPATNVPPNQLGFSTPVEPLPARPGYGTDPDLMRAYQQGDYWPLTLAPEQRETVAALADVILPGDERSPSATSVGVVDFIDEWVSAPYPSQQVDRRLILQGLPWLDAEARERFSAPFAQLHETQQNEICDAICSVERAAPEYRDPARFFHTFRDLVMAGFYTTPEGSRDIGYVGNLPSQTFAGPPPEVLARLGLS